MMYSKLYRIRFYTKDNVYTIGLWDNEMPLIIFTDDWFALKPKYIYNIYNIEKYIFLLPHS